MTGRKVHNRSIRFSGVAPARLIGAIVGMLCVTGGIATATSAAAAVHKTQLQIGQEFYRGKTITLIASGGAGTSLDLYSRAVGPVMGIYLHATVNIEDISGANSVLGQNTMYNAPPNGLTVGTLNTATDVLDNLTGVGGPVFSLGQMTTLAGTLPLPGCMLASTASGLTTFSQIVGTTVPVKELIEASGSATVETLLLNAAVPLNAQTITGFTTAPGLLTGLLQGDGAITFSSLSEGAPFIEGGLARCLYLNTALPKYESKMAIAKYLKDIPLLPSLLIKYHGTTGVEKAAAAALADLVAHNYQYVFAVNGQVGAPETAALRAALKFALENKGVQSMIAQDGLPPGWVSGAFANEQNAETAKALEAVKYLL